MHFYRTENNDVKIDNYSQKAYFFNLIIIYGCSAAYPQENLIRDDCYYPHEIDLHPLSKNHFDHLHLHSRSKSLKTMCPNKIDYFK